MDSQSFMVVNEKYANKIKVPVESLQIWLYIMPIIQINGLNRLNFDQNLLE